MAPALLADVRLPVGSAPPALTFAHFPDRLHAFIWRNWNLVPSERMARVVGAKPRQIAEIARAMGLGDEDVLSAAKRERIYLSIIRRNWHLLPYEQLLELLDWTPARMDEALREDDFLWHKLGQLKPRCERLEYREPTQEMRRREAEIAAIVREISREDKGAGEKPCDFLDRFTKPAKLSKTRGLSPAAGNGVRFLYSYFAVYGDPLIDPSLDPYPDGLLQKYADLGVNGVWLHVVLRDLAPSPLYPEFGEGSARRLENLRKLVARAKRFGIGAYLYTNEPRSMPAEFFRNHPDDAGVREGPLVAMCTSSPHVRQWLGDSLEYVFKSVPDLAGVFTITASENLTNCASHGHSDQCPRCKKRLPADVIADVNSLMAEGVHRGSAKAKVIVWDWGWKEDQAHSIIEKLPANVLFMSVSEWGLRIVRGGVKDTVAEYSISAIGPGPRALDHWSLARERGLECVAKVQVNNSWEISAVPYLPVMDLVAKHGENLSKAGVSGEMLSWSLGGYPSPNLEIAARNSKDVLDSLAQERYGAGAKHARKAWTAFSEAFSQYPFDQTVVYRCPVQLGPANLLWLKPTGYASTMVGFPYDDLNAWRGPYPPAIFASQFEKVAEGWKVGMDELAAAVRQAPADRMEDARAEYRFATAAELHFRSVANQVRFDMARSDVKKNADELRRIVKDEETAAVELYRLCREDSRIGFEASNQYYYLPQDLIEKVLNCREVEKQFR